MQKIHLIMEVSGQQGEVTPSVMLVTLSKNQMEEIHKLALKLTENQYVTMGECDENIPVGTWTSDFSFKQFESDSADELACQIEDALHELNNHQLYYHHGIKHCVVTSTHVFWEFIYRFSPSIYTVKTSKLPLAQLNMADGIGDKYLKVSLDNNSLLVA